MICQYCGKNEASTHVTRIVNGESMELHLCLPCAKALGYSDMFDFGLNFGDIFGGFFGAPIGRFPSDVIRCEKCGCSFDDITKTGTVGCAECYNTFRDRLMPSVERIHGNTKHCGKIPKSANVRSKEEDAVASLEEELKKAIDRQDFESAARLRDELKELRGED